MTEGERAVNERLDRLTALVRLYSRIPGVVGRAPTVAADGDRAGYHPAVEVGDDEAGLTLTFDGAYTLRGITRLDSQEHPKGLRLVIEFDVSSLVTAYPEES